MDAYRKAQQQLQTTPRRWLVTGAAGFIGSHITEQLLALSQQVVGLDNFMTGSRTNLEAATKGREGQFRFIEGDIRDPSVCAGAMEGIDIVVHQAALGSVPRSLADPRLVHTVNVDGFLNMLLAARDAGVKRFVYASSSSCYGDSETLPKREGEEGRPLSPYAATKAINDVYGSVFAHAYGMETAGLRYFNVFGPRQDPLGPYAAVIPLWMRSLLRGETCHINGDGKTSRDFCYVANAVQANILAGTAERLGGDVINVAVGGGATLAELFDRIRNALAKFNPSIATVQPAYRDFRPGDIRHSLADITRAKTLLGYHPTHNWDRGIDETAAWYAAQG